MISGLSVLFFCMCASVGKSEAVPTSHMHSTAGVIVRTMPAIVSCNIVMLWRLDFGVLCRVFVPIYIDEDHIDAHDRALQQLSHLFCGKCWLRAERERLSLNVAIHSLQSL